jgi:hypothetical protein
MDFAVTEWAARSFWNVCASLEDELAESSPTPTGFLATELRVETRPLEVVGPEAAVLRAAWRDDAGRLHLKAELRVLGVNRGAEPLTEILMIGHGPASGHERSSVLAWAHTVLAAMTERPRSTDRAGGEAGATVRGPMASPERDAAHMGPLA